MKCLNLNIPDFRKAAAIIGDVNVAKIVDSFPENYTPTFDDIMKKHGELRLPEQQVARNQIGELLTASEANNLFETYNPTSSRKLLKNWFFGVPTKNAIEREAFKIVDLAYLTSLAGKESYGLFMNGVTYLADLGTKGVPLISKNALKEEVMHRILWGYLSANERFGLLQSFKNKYPNLNYDSMTEEDVEELFVDEFIAYKADKNNSAISNTLKNLFYKILRAFNLLNIHKMEMNKFFNLVNSGFFSGNPINPKVKVTRRMEKAIVRKFTTVENYVNAQRFVLDQIRIANSFNPLEGDDISKAVPYTFLESIDQAFKTINKIKSDLVRMLLSSEKIKSSAEYIKYKEYETKIEAIDKLVKEKNIVLTEAQTEKYNELQKAAKIQLKKLAGTKSVPFTKQWNLINSVSNYNNYKLIIDSLYPDASKYIDAYDLGNETDETFNWANEINSKEDVDLRINIIAQVKQMLGTISYLEEGVRTYVPFNQAYAILLKSMDKFNLNVSTNDMLKYLDAAFNNIGLTPKTSAIKNRIIDIINNSFPKANETYLKFLQFKSDDVVVLDVRQEAENNTGENLRFVPLDKIRYLQNKGTLTNYKLIEKIPGETQKDFVSRVYELAKNTYPNSNLITPTNVVAAYRMFSNLNMLANIQTAIGTMRERKPKIAVRIWEKNKLMFRYISARESGVSAVYASSFITAFENILSSAFSSKKKLTKEETDVINENRKYNRLLNFNLPVDPSMDEKLATIKSFLAILNVPAIKDNIKTLDNYSRIDVLYEDIVYQLRRIKSAPINTDISQLLFYEETKLIYHLTDIFSNVDEAIIPTNYIAGDGKTRYMHSLSSWGMEVLKYFTKNGAILKGKMPDYLRTPFYANNLFNKGILTLEEYIDHDSNKYSGNDASAVLHKNEKPVQWFTRNFHNMFIGALKNTGSIFQQTYTISDKPNIVGARVNFIKPDQYVNILYKLIEQESYRPENLPVKNYTPDKSYLLGLKERFKQTGDKKQDELIINKKVDLMLREFDKMAEELIDWILLNNVRLPDELDELYAANVFQTKNEFSDLKIKSFKELFASLSKASFEEHLKNLEKEANIQNAEDLEQSETEPDSDFDGIVAEDKTLVYENYRADQIAQLKEALSPIMKSFAINFYVNSHQLNQLLAGDFAFYKSRSQEVVDEEPYDIIKRMSIVFGPGRAGAVKNNYYLPEKTRVAVLEDLTGTVTTEEISEYHPELVGDTFDATDAQGYITPEYFEMLKLAHGVESKQGYILKPVYFGIDENGIPRAIKFSAVVLTDELVEAFPGLNKLRNQMVEKNVNMSVFASAVKVGVPKNLTKLYKTDSDGNKVLIDEDMAVPNSIEDESIMSIDSANLRLQFNPAKKLIGKVTNPSQMTFLGAMNDSIIEKLDSLLNRNAAILRIGRQMMSRELRLQNGRPTYKKDKSRNILRKRVLRSLQNIAGSDKEADILDNANASINLPMIANKVISSLASMYDSSTVDIKLRGSKLILQSEFGTFAKSLNKPKLRWKDENGLTEVYVSKDLLESYGLKIGDVILPDAFKAMGFRTPSTGLHSALALKIVGDYPSPDPTLANIIIAPSRIVHVHGSDFDVDSLGIIIRSKVEDVFGKDTGVHLGKLLDIVMPGGVFSKNELLNFGPKQLIGYDANYNPIQIMGAPLETIIERVLDKIKVDVREAFRNKNITRAQELIGTEDNPELGVEYKLIKIYKEIQKNKIVDDFISILTDPSSRSAMELPISMDRIKKQTEGTEERGMLQIVAAMRDPSKSVKEVLYPAIDLSKPLDQLSVHRNATSGLVIRGAGSNAIKIFAYTKLGAKIKKFINPSGEVILPEEAEILKQTNFDAYSKLKKIREQVKLKDNIRVNFNGAAYTTLSDVELKPDSEGKLIPNVIKLKDVDGKEINKVYSIWDTLDSLINAAIDNVKEQIIYLINLTTETSNEYFSALFLGIPLDTVVRFMSSPVLFETAFAGNLKNTDALDKLESALVYKYLTVANNIKSLKELSAEEKQVYETLKEDLYKLIEESTLTDAEMENSGLFWNQKIKEHGSLNNAIFNTEISNNEESLALVLTQIKVIKQYRELEKIGDKLFTASNASNVIREMDSNYTDMKSKLEAMLIEVSTFGGRKAAVQKFDKEIKPILLASSEYQQAEDKEKFIQKELNKFIKTKVAKQTALANAVNQILRGVDSGYSAPAEDWPFSNSSMLAVPNVRESFKTLIELVNVIESLIFKHSRGMNAMAEDVLKATNIVSKFNNRIKSAENVKNEFMNFFLSGVNLNLGGNNLKLSLPIGIDMRNWVSILKNDLENLKRALAQKGIQNSFLNHVTFVKDKKSRSYKLVFTSDKMGDPEVEALFKSSFKQLGSDIIKITEKELVNSGKYSLEFNTDSNVEYSDISLRLIKYLMVSRGVDFGRTSYSMLLPDSFYSALSNELEDNFEQYTILDLEGKRNANITKLIDAFKIQYALNNASNLNLINSQQVYKPKEEEEQIINNTQYDLVIKGHHYPQFVTYKYGNQLRVYAKLNTITVQGLEDSPAGVNLTGYRFIGYANYNKQIYMHPKTKSDGFDINKILTNPIFESKDVSSGVLVQKNKGYVLPINSLVYVKSEDDIGLQNLYSYIITGVNNVIENDENKIHYTLAPFGPVNSSSDIIIPSTTIPTSSAPASQTTDNIEGLDAQEEIGDVITDADLSTLSDERSDLSAAEYNFVLQQFKNNKLLLTEKSLQKAQQVVNDSNRIYSTIFPSGDYFLNSPHGVNLELNTFSSLFISNNVDKDLLKTFLELKKLSGNTARVYVSKYLINKDGSSPIASYYYTKDILSINLGLLMGNLKNKDNLNKTEILNELLKVLNHELGHAVSIQTINKYQNDYFSSGNEEGIPKVVKDIFEAYTYVKSFYNINIDNPQMKDYFKVSMSRDASLPLFYFNYYLTSPTEFATAIFSDPEFGNSVNKILELKDLNSKNKRAKKNKSLFESIRQLFKKLIDFILGRDSQINLELNSYINLVKLAEINKKIKLQDIPDLDNTPAYLASSNFNKDSQEKITSNLEKLLNHENVSGVTLEEDVTDGKYINAEGGRFSRLTEFIGNNFFIKKKSTEKEADYYANRDYKSQGLATTEPIKILTDGNVLRTFTYDQLVDYHVRKGNNFKRWGKATHAYIEALLNTDPNKVETLNNKLTSLLAPQKDENGKDISDPVDLSKISWLSSGIQDILIKAGINIDLLNPGLNKDRQDKIIPEIPIILDSLGIGTTIDNLVAHPNGDFSVIDWKTGSLLSDFSTSELMKWGANVGMTNSKLNKAKLEVALRALAVKAAVPEAKFRNLSVVWIGSENKFKIHEIDLQDYLTVLSEYMQNEAPEAFEAYNSKGLFDAKNYLSQSKYQTNYESKINGMSLADKKQWVNSRLEYLRLKYSSPEIENKNKVSQEIQDLTNLRIELDALPNINYEAPQSDIGLLGGVMNNIKDVSNPVIKLFANIMFNQKNKVREEQESLYKEYEEKFNPVLQEYLQSKGLDWIPKILSSRINNVLGRGLNKRELYAFMWSYNDSEARKGYYANLGDTYLDPISKEVKLMTDKQKAFRDWYLQKMNNLYATVMSEQLTDENGRSVSKAQLMKAPATLYQGFMPRTALMNSDIMESDNSILKKSGILAKQYLLENVTNILEETYEGDTSRGIPVRYYSSINSSIITEGNHSFDIEVGFKKFTDNLIFKKHMDEVYALGEGIKFQFADKKNEFGEKLYPNLTKFMENHVLIHVLQTTPDGKFFQKEFSINVSPQMSKIFGVPEGRLKINMWKVSRMLKSGVSMAAMTFKAIAAAGNAGLILISNHFKGFAGSVAKIFGVPPQQIEFDFPTILKADLAIIKYWANRFMGNHENDKLWNITTQLRFLPDNFDFSASDNSMMVVKNSLFNKKHLYVFHTLFEEYGAMSILHSTLNNVKYEWTNDETGEKKVASLYEMYDNKGVFDNKWSRGIVKINGENTKLKGLTSQEITTFKRIHERIHGSYRQEERLALELTVLGQWALQFKKYLPTLFKLNWRGEFDDQFLGNYEVKLIDGIPQVEDGLNVYEWQNKLTQGRVNLMLKHLFVTTKSLLGSKEEGYDTTKYLWNNLNNEKRKTLIEAYGTITLLMILPALLMAGFDDDDENKTWYKRLNKMFEDATLGMDPRDLLRPLKNNPIPVASRIVDILDASVELLWEGIIQGEEDSRGVVKGARNLGRNLPVFSAAQQWNTFMEDWDENFKIWELDRLR